VTERTNALHAVPPADGVDLVVVDLGWTVQRLVVPAALKWLRAAGRIITLIKPHYEAKEFGIEVPRKGVLIEEVALQINSNVVDRMCTMGVTVRAVTKSPILGGKEKATGNPEWLALLEISPAPAS
jgi:23S rRNA (cytidine1920-2'-O)/16S rRNA (cytidine1409-2'-O)-methyltransferase